MLIDRPNLQLRCCILFCYDAVGIITLMGLKYSIHAELPVLLSHSRAKDPWSAGCLHFVLSVCSIYFQSDFIRFWEELLYSAFIYVYLNCTIWWWRVYCICVFQLFLTLKRLAICRGWMYKYWCWNIFIYSLLYQDHGVQSLPCHDFDAWVFFLLYTLSQWFASAG